MRTSLCLPAIAMLAALGLGPGGCSRDKPAPAAQGSASGAGSAAATTATAPAGLEIFVNDASIGRVQPAQVAAWTRLDSLVPGEVRKLGTWDRVALEGAGKPVEVNHPSSSYPDMVPAVFPGEGGAASFGMFDAVELAKHGKPAMRADGVTAIRIAVKQGGNRGQNDDGGGAAADPTTLVVTVKTAAGTTSLTGDKLLGLPREGQPGNPDQKGWRLQALLDAAGVQRFDRLVLSDAAGTNLTIDRKDIDASTVPFIKLNKQGTLRLRVLKKTGEGWNPAGDLRGLVAIEVR